MQCEYSTTCVFMENLRRLEPMTAETVEITYCEINKYDCVRYGLFQVTATDDVPDFLWPNDEEEALEVFRATSRSWLSR